MQAIYTVENNGISYQTTDAAEAEELSNEGANVKSHFAEIVQQTDTHKGTLILSETEDWDKGSFALMAAENSWFSLGLMR